jgi:uracil-DNA glycosylase family 4
MNMDENEKESRKERLNRSLSEIAADALDFLKTGFRSAGAAAPGGSPPETAAGLTGAGSPKRGLFDAVVREVLSCTKCPLHRGRRNAVPGTGDIGAAIVFIGEGPGEMEDIKGEPFVGRAGQLLTKMLAGIALTREEVYITNIVKCRPPNNRAPLPEESRACFPYLERQLELIDPKVICCLGGPAAQVVLGTSLGITKLRGTFHRFRGIPVIPTYHPAAVLRFPEKYKRDVWNDLKMLRDFCRDLKKG